MKITNILGLAVGLTLLSSVSGMAKGRKLDKGILKEVGNSLIKNDGTKTTEDFSGCKYMMYLFGASWKKGTAPFVDKVADFYNKNRAKYKLGAVYVSSDFSKNALKNFLDSTSMPWNSLQFDKKGLKERLKKGLNAMKVPSMVIVDKKGRVVLSSSVDAVTNDNTASNTDIVEKFAGVLSSSLGANAKMAKNVVGEYDLAKILGDTVYTKKGFSSQYTPFKHKYNVVYCSAHYCPPCRKFTPQLVKAYNDNMRRNNISLTFVSFDHTEAAMKNYMKETNMPWFSTKFDPARLHNFRAIFKVNGIPALLVFDNAGNLLRSSARGDNTIATLSWLKTVSTK